MKKSLILPALLLIVPLALWLMSDDDSLFPENPRPVFDKSSTTVIDSSNSKTVNKSDEFLPNPQVRVTKEAPSSPAPPKANYESNSEGASDELPDDLKRQLESPPPELPDDLKSQLSNPNPEIPEDIRRAMEVPPRKVSIEEVNNPPPSLE